MVGKSISVSAGPLIAPNNPIEYLNYPSFAENENKKGCPNHGAASSLSGIKLLAQKIIWGRLASQRGMSAYSTTCPTIL